MKHAIQDPDGNVTIIDIDDVPRPLSDAGVMATLNVVLGIWPLDDAANAVGLSPDDLINEALAWGAAQSMFDL